MKLSEAIRLGSMLKPQAFGHFDTGRGTCALGAAREAAGGMSFPISTASPATCPACQQVMVTSEKVWATAATVVHLNDKHRWTRERIADWVEGVGAAQANEQPQ